MALKVGIVRDERYLDHMPGHTHPEHPRRLRRIYEMLDKDFPEGLILIQPEPATLEQLELVHTPAYIERVLKTADHKFTNLAPDTPVSAKTYLAAWLAVGGCINGLEAIIAGQCDVCFALIRPPGHHALRNRASGFCILNNLGITARYAQNKWKVRRILIIDWDIHHGNGIHELFYDEKEVLYFSTHDILLYPYTGNLEESGSGKGEGYTINIPIPRDLTDKEFFHIYRDILSPVMQSYVPELILVAAGFDAHDSDPIGRSRLDSKTFGWLTKLLLHLRKEIGQPPVLLALEGGYDQRAAADSVKTVLNALTTDDNVKVPSDIETPRSLQLVEDVRNIHKKFGVWTD